MFCAKPAEDNPMAGTVLALAIGLVAGAGVGFLLGFPILGGGVGVTVAVVAAAALDSLIGSSGRDG